MIQFQFQADKSTLRCDFSGRMDSPTSMDAEKTIRAKVSEAATKVPPSTLNVIFNLTDVDYIASAFIRICLETAKTAGRAQFSVTNTNPFVMKIFKMAGLDKELNVS